MTYFSDKPVKQEQSSGGQAKVNTNSSSVISSFKSCKFCSLTNHSTLHCKLCNNFDKRYQKAQQLGICVKCFSMRQKEKDCPGSKGKLPFPCNSCKTTEHVTPMCNNIMLSWSPAKKVTGNGKTDDWKWIRTLTLLVQ